MDTEKRLYRSRHALIGGVCAGIAEYFSVDPLIARILTVVVTLLTAGLFGVAYVALWVILPQASDGVGPVDVEPHSVRSDTYGHMNSDDVRDKADAARAATEAAAAQQRAAYGTYGGIGHVPPEPPAAAAAAWSHSAAQQVPPGWQAPAWRGVDWQTESPATQSWPSDCGQTPYPPQQPQASSPPPYSQPVAQPAAAQVVDSAPAAKHNRGNVKAAVFLGSFVLFFGFAALLGEWVDGLSWWRFWPLVFGIVGIMWMVVPGDPGHRMSQFVSGLIMFFLSGTLLSMSLGVFSWATVPNMFAGLWPLLIIMVGFFIIGGATRSAWLILAAGLCFVAFCILGLGWFAISGETSAFVLTLPFGRQYVLPLELFR